VGGLLGIFLLLVIEERGAMFDVDRLTGRKFQIWARFGLLCVDISKHLTALS
jgi:hypothetical protein